MSNPDDTEPVSPLDTEGSDAQEGKAPLDVINIVPRGNLKALETRVVVGKLN